MPDVTSWSDDDLRAAVVEARRRLPHHETCEHCDGGAEYEALVAGSTYEVFATFSERAAAAGFVRGQGKNIVHRWDCPAIESYIRQQQDWLGSAGPETVARVVDGGAGPSEPLILTALEAREYLAGGKGARRACRTCSPDL